MTTASDATISREIARLVLTFSVAAAGGVGGYVAQSDSVDNRLETLEKHADYSHPPEDYRKLLDERIQWINERISRHERNHPNERK